MSEESLNSDLAKLAKQIAEQLEHSAWLERENESLNEDVHQLNKRLQAAQLELKGERPKRGGKNGGAVGGATLLTAADIHREYRILLGYDSGFKANLDAHPLTHQQAMRGLADYANSHFAVAGAEPAAQDVEEPLDEADPNHLLLRIGNLEAFIGDTTKRVEVVEERLGDGVVVGEGVSASFAEAFAHGHRSMGMTLEATRRVVKSLADRVKSVEWKLRNVASGGGEEE